jgi:large subunit ribosomal protein L4
VAIIKKYNLSGEEIGQLSLDDTLLEGVANSQMVKDYLVAYRANQRQWSANTKTRAEVSHSGQKPHPQKGTGRARQGYLGSPQYKGGGRVFGPRPKFDQQVRLNKKEKRAVIRSLLIQKIQEQRFCVLSTEGLDKPKTKFVVEFLKKVDLMQKRVLFLGEDLYAAKGSELEAAYIRDLFMDADEETAKVTAEKREEEFSSLADSYSKREAIIKSVRNVPELSFALVPNLNGYEVILNNDIVLLDGAFDQLVAFLGGK